MIDNTQDVSNIYHILVLIVITLITCLTCVRLCPTNHVCVNSLNPYQVDMKQLTPGYVGRGRLASKVKPAGP